MADNNEYKSLYDCEEIDGLIEANVYVDGRKSRIPMQHVMAMPSFMMSHDYLDAKEGQNLGQIVVYYPKDSRKGLETGKNLRLYGNLRKIESAPYKGFYLILDKEEILD